MKKLLSILLVIIAVLTGCSNEDSLANQLEDIDQIDYVSFYQTMAVGGSCNQEKGIEDIEKMLEIFEDVSSNSESYEENLEEYLEKGFDRLSAPSIYIHYLSGDMAQIQWKTGTGILVYDGVEYYIDRAQAKMLYDIFTKYSPNIGNGKIM